jgi:hypothetical protein
VAEHLDRRDRVLGETHPIEVVAVVLITSTELSHVGAHGFDKPGDVGAEDPVPGPT